MMKVFGGCQYKATTDVNVVLVFIASDSEYRVPWPVDRLPIKT
jgi:hypothetical protein